MFKSQSQDTTPDGRGYFWRLHNNMWNSCCCFLFLKENLFNSSSNEWESRPSGFQWIWRAQFAQQPATKNNMWTISLALLTFSFLIFDVADIVTTPNASDDVTATTTTAAAIVTVWQWCNQWWSRHAAVKRGANMTVRIGDSRTCSCCFPLLSPLFQVNESCTWFWNILYYYVTYLAADSREIERLWKQITTQDAQAPLLTDTGNACSSHRHELLLL